jgi:hypothetical protein
LVSHRGERRLSEKKRDLAHLAPKSPSLRRPGLPGWGRAGAIPAAADNPGVRSGTRDVTCLVDQTEARKVLSVAKA